MDEASKSKKFWSELEWTVLQGEGIDIGCGPDPVKPDVRRFDMQDGDANVITRHVKERFDFVFSSHCLEHMHKPREAILEWWQLVKPGGHLFFLVPDEDLYEQGVFPSRFNPDHKATFTISKRESWSPVSINVLDLARSLPDGELISLELQDHKYDRSRMTFQKEQPRGPVLVQMFQQTFAKILAGRVHRWCWSYYVSHTLDQTLAGIASAQIQCIVRRSPGGTS